MLIKIFFIFVIVFFGLQSLYAESNKTLMELPFEELFNIVVTTSTITEKASLKAPSSMTVITEEEINALGVTDLFDLIDQIPGFFAKTRRNGSKPFIFRGIQGTSANEKFKLLINGHAVSEPMWGSFIFYDVSLKNIRQIEIIRGPGSSLYGTNAFAGVINIITKKPSEIRGIDVDVSYDSFDTNKLDINYGKKINEEMEFGFFFSYFDSDGADDLTLEQDRLTGTPFTLTPVDLDLPETRYKAETNFIYNNFSTSVGFSCTEVKRPLAQLYYTEKGETKEYDYGYIITQYNYIVSDNFKINAKASYDIFNKTNEGQIFPTNMFLSDRDGDGDIEFWRDGARYKFYFDSKEIRGEIGFDFKITESNEFLIGTFYEYIETSDVGINTNFNPNSFSNLNAMVDLRSYGVNWNKDSNRTIIGAFFQDEWDITDDFYFILGGRYDDYDDFGSIFNPRAGFVWNYDQKGGVFKIFYGSAFRAPTFSQLYDSSSSVKGNPELDPEKLNSIEVAWSNVFYENLVANISIYFLETEDMISVLPGTTSVSRFDNLGETEVQGVELDFKYIFSKNSYINFNYYNIFKAEDCMTGNDLSFIAKHQANCGLNYLFNEKINFNLNVDYTGDLSRDAGDPRDDLDSTITVDVTVRFLNINGWTFYISAYNLFDEDLYAPGRFSEYPESDIPSAGDHYRVGVHYKFG